MRWVRIYEYSISAFVSLYCNVATRSAPWFNLVPENITKVVKYEDLNLTCAAVGVPFPKVTCIRNIRRILRVIVLILVRALNFESAVAPAIACALPPRAAASFPHLHCLRARLYLAFTFTLSTTVIKFTPNYCAIIPSRNLNSRVKCFLSHHMLT